MNPDLEFIPLPAVAAQLRQIKDEPAPRSEPDPDWHPL